MQFDQFRTLKEDLKSIKEASNYKVADFYSILLANPPRDENDIIHQKRACLEALWYRAKRPFYKVWPSIMPYLIKTKLSFTLKDLNLTQRVFAIFLPAGNGSILVYTDKEIFVCCVELPTQHFGLVTFRGADTVIEDAVEQEEQFIPRLRLAVAVLLLEHDPSIIEPEVLARDRAKWEETHDPKFIERAKRLGVNGWRIGERMETIPHIRRPHFAIRWTGKGRTTPIMTAIKGSIVHREVVEKVPTDYLDK